MALGSILGIPQNLFRCCRNFSIALVRGKWTRLDHADRTHLVLATWYNLKYKTMGYVVGLSLSGRWAFSSSAHLDLVPRGGAKLLTVFPRMHGS